MLPLLLVICLNREVASPLRAALNVAGFKAYYVESLGAALGITQQWQFDAVLIETVELGVDVVDVVKGLRGQMSLTPVLVVLRSDDEEVLLQLLGVGANQVMPRAPSPRVIATQLHRWVDVFRSREKEDSTPVQVGPLRLDPRRASATIDGMNLKLTATEFELLLLLAAAAGELVHRTKISRTLSSVSGADRRRTADMHVSRIRRKLRIAGGDALELMTVYGQGYLLRLLPQHAEAEPPRVEWSV